MKRNGTLFCIFLLPFPALILLNDNHELSKKAINS